MTVNRELDLPPPLKPRPILGYNRRMSSVSPLRVGIIGLGEVAVLRHLPILARHPRFQITAAADIDLARAQHIGAQYGIPRIYPDARALLDLPDIEAVAIFTPPVAHAELVHAALDAHKHVFVEKPLTLDVAQAESLAAHASRVPARVLVGFNLRHHPQIRRAREWLRAGRIGAIRAVHTTFTNVAANETASPWRLDPARGGSLLYELGVHHLDACRYLCDADIATIFAQQTLASHGQPAVTFQARLTNDILLTGVLAQDTIEHNSIELIGEHGRMVLSLYRFDGPFLYPRGAYDDGWGLRFHHARATLQALPQALSQQRQGGAYVSSYRAEWEHFFQIVRHSAVPLASLADGVAATRAAAAAQASLVQHQTSSFVFQRPNLFSKHATSRTFPTMSVDVAPPDGLASSLVAVTRAAPLLEIAQAKTLQQAATAHQVDSVPVLSAIVVIPDRFETVRDIVRALAAQTIAAQIELVFVVPTPDVALPAGALDRFHAWQKIPAPILSMGQAYAVGIRQARAPLVALTEDHSFPEPHWAERLVAAHNTNAAHRTIPAVVAPAMRIGNPNTLVSWADFLIGYGKWAEPISSQAMDFLPGHNSVYRLCVLRPYFARLDEWFDAETVLHWELRRQGHSLWLEGSTYTSHLNFARWRPFLRAQLYSGRTFAARRAISWRWSKRFAYGLFSPLIPVVRFVRLLPDVRRGQFDWKFRLRLYVAIFLGLVADGLAQGLGYFAGADPDPDSSDEMHFHRDRYIVPHTAPDAAPHAAPAANLPHSDA